MYRVMVPMWWFNQGDALDGTAYFDRGQAVYVAVYAEWKATVQIP